MMAIAQPVGRRAALIAALALMVVLPAAAVEPDEMLSDPRLEARARAISAELRCLVCQNQSIDDSNAPLARDLRLIVRERLAAGDSDDAVFGFVVARYGTFVLLRPPISPGTALLWTAPVLILLALALVLVRRWRQQPAAPSQSPAGLSEAETERLNRLLGGEREKRP